MANAIVPSLTQNLDDFFLASWDKSIAETIKVALDTPLWKRMSARGRMKKQVGGQTIVADLMYGDTPVYAIGRGGEVDYADPRLVTQIREEWRYIVSPLVRFWVDDQQLTGPSKRRDFVKDKMENARMSLGKNFERMAIADGTGQSSQEINGLAKIIVPVDPATTTAAQYDALHGIDGDNTTLWRNQYQDIDDVLYPYVSDANADKLRWQLRTTYNNCAKWGSPPTTMFCDQDFFENLEDAIGHKGTIILKPGSKFDVEAESIRFKGADVFWSAYLSASPPDGGTTTLPADADGNASAGAMYFVNENFLKIVYDPRIFMQMTGWERIPKRLDRVAYIVSALQMLCLNRNAQGLVTAGDFSAS